MNKGSQVTDQTIKGVVVGAVAYFLAKGNVDPAIQASIIPIITAGLAYASTMVGDKNVASFLAKIAKEAPKIIEEVEKEVVKAKAATKKTAPKKK
jgi:hypothetical protein